MYQYVKYEKPRCKTADARTLTKPLTKKSEKVPVGRIMGGTFTKIKYILGIAHMYQHIKYEKRRGKTADFNAITKLLTKKSKKVLVGRIMDGRITKF